MSFSGLEQDKPGGCEPLRDYLRTLGDREWPLKNSGVRSESEKSKNDGPGKSRWFLSPESLFQPSAGGGVVW